ncbi:hypothetical protein ACFWZU_15605 [Frateuria sp. GZRR33]
MHTPLRVTIGVDPGLHGAVSILVDDRFHAVHDTPTMGTGKSGRQSVNAAALAEIVRTELARFPGVSVRGVVEQVGARPTDGKAAAFRFGETYGAIKGIFGALRIPYTTVAPVKWKRFYNLIGTEKDAARGKAIELFPEAPLSRKKDCDRADAILIGYWGWRYDLVP